MKKIVLTLALALVACRTPPVQENITPEDASVRDRLDAVRKAYTPASCFYASFGVELRVPGQSAQQADGSVRVDNENRRVRFYFMDPIFGIVLQHLTIRDGFVYAGSPRDPSVRIEQDRFVVSGLGNNSMRLPFNIFQDLMYGRIPEEVFAAQTKYRTDKNRLIAEREDAVSRSVYEFENDRLRSMDYLQKSDSSRVRAVLTGRYMATPFPQRMELDGSRGGPAEKMIVDFRSVEMPATCKEVHFPAQ
jgi:hypothetical protein